MLCVFRRGLLVLTFVLLAGAGAAAQNEDVIEHANSIWARVNDDVLTTRDVYSALLGEFEALDKTWKDPQKLLEKRLEAVKAYTRRWVENRLVIAEAQARGIFVTTKQVEDAFDKEWTGKFADLATYEDFLNRNGRTIADRKEELKEDLLRNKLEDEIIGNKVFVRPGEIRAYYEKHRAEFVAPERVVGREIVMWVLKEAFPNERACRDAAGAKMDAIEQQALAGADFATLAAEHSELESSKKLGGMINKTPIRRGTLRPEVEEALFSMEIGEVRRVYVDLDDRVCCALLRLEDKLPTQTESFEDVRELIFNKVFQEKYRAAIDGFFAGMREKYVVKEEQ